MCITGKREYQNARAARTALSQIRVARDERRKRRRREQAIYPCKLCHHFHLTSEPVDGERERFR
jgi:hypothetical protein